MHLTGTNLKLSAFKKIGLAGLMCFVCGGFSCSYAHAGPQFTTSPPWKKRDAYQSHQDSIRQAIAKQKHEEENRGFFSTEFGSDPTPVDVSKLDVDWTNEKDIELIKTLPVWENLAFYKRNLKLIIHDQQPITGPLYRPHIEWIMKWAVMVDDPDIIKDFDKKGVNLNMMLFDDGTRLMHQAVETQSAHSLAALIELGADVNIKNNQGETPLHQAVKERELNMVKVLADAGVDVNVKNSRGATPLLMALADDNPAMVKELVENGADPNMKFTFTRDINRKEFKDWPGDLERLWADQNKLMSPLDFVLFIRRSSPYIRKIKDKNFEAELRAAGAKEFHKPVRFPRCRAAFASIFKRA